MRILILGGTVFLGRAITDAAIQRGHSVTHVNRGKTNGTDPRVETIRMDRETSPFLGGSYSERSWDVVIDTCGYMPQVVGHSARSLAERVDRYVFISSISAYQSFENDGFDESAPLQSAPSPLPNEFKPELYGALKAACEREVLYVFDDRAIIIRPGLIVGPADQSDRFTWWPWRIADGGDFVAPGRPARPIQYIDVRDIAEWLIGMIERGHGGVFNATSPAGASSMGDLIDACLDVTANSAAPVWIPDEFLLRQKIEPWIQMPLWIPESDVAFRGFMHVSVDRAVQHGMTFRPIRKTVTDTLEWASARPGDHVWRAGLTPTAEKNLIRAWRSPAAAH